MRLHRSYMGRPELCEFPTSTFSYAIILASVYEPYLIFLVSRTFYHVHIIIKGALGKRFEFDIILIIS